MGMYINCCNNLVLYTDIVQVSTNTASNNFFFYLHICIDYVLCLSLPLIPLTPNRVVPQMTDAVPGMDDLLHNYSVRVQVTVSRQMSQIKSAFVGGFYVRSELYS